MFYFRFPNLMELYGTREIAQRQRYKCFVRFNKDYKQC